MDAEREVVRRWHKVAHEVRRVDAIPCGIRALRYGVDRTHSAIAREQGSVSGVAGETPSISQRKLAGLDDISFVQKWDERTCTN